MKAIFLHPFHLRVFVFVFYLLFLLSLGSLFLVFLDPNCIVAIRDWKGIQLFLGIGNKTTKKYLRSIETKITLETNTRLAAIKLPIRLL